MMYNFQVKAFFYRSRIRIVSVIILCFVATIDTVANDYYLQPVDFSLKTTDQIGRKKVTGKVLDEFGDPIPSASVLVAGSPRGVFTDIDGSFEIEVSDNDKLEFSFLGMETQVISVGTKKQFLINLKPKAAELDEVTVVAYGKQRKESIIGAINTVTTDKLKLPVAKLSSGLAGQLAGIVVMQRSGEPGAGADFWIRGVNTFGANNKPLVLVDGIERDLDLVDAEDIASFSILKDATATALYGVRGANGIVLITTKRGTESAPKVSARVEYGFSSPVRLPKLASASQWIDYYNDITLEASGKLAIQPEQRAAYLNGSDPDLYPNVDWMSTIFKDISNSTRVNVNVTGGSPKVRYYVGGSYYTEGSIFNVGDTDRYDASMKYNRFNFRSNIDINITSSTELGLSLSTQYETKNRPGSSLSTLYAYTIITPPLSIPTVYSDGTISRPVVGINPYNALNGTGYSQDFANNAQSLFSLTQDFSNIITPGLKANVKYSWDAYNGSTLDRTIAPSTYFATGRDDNGDLILVKNNDGSDYMTLSRSNSGSRTTNFEASLNYDQVFGQDHRVGGLFLFNMRSRTNNFPASYIYAFPYRNTGIAGRATYSYGDRYFTEFNFGYNGSENFSPKKRFGFFPSFALGYLISNESYWNSLRSLVHLLKLKGSYGEIGNDQIGGDRRFAFNSEMNSNASGYIFGTNPGSGYISGIATGVPGNEYVAWEKAKKGNIGLEVGFFNKLNLQVDYFDERRSGIYIQQESVPSVVGQNVTQYVNLGKMKNQGFDVSLEYEQRLNDWYFSARANFNYNKNKVLYDDKPTPIWPYLSATGYPYNQQRGLISLGLFESEQDIADSPKHTFGNVRPGDIKYKDINGDNVIDANDMVAIGHTNIPEINYGFGVSVGWKGFDLSLFFQGVGRVTQIIGGSAFYGASDNILNTGQIYKDVAENRWSLDNPDPNALYPRLSMSKVENNLQASTFWLRDMSFIRLKNTELGYTIPKSISRKLRLSSVRIYTQGVNLLTFSKFKLWDPELASSYGNVYPQMKSLTLGLNVNF
ncbi:TonB-dependent receptor [Dysgonomonas sp. BGC7]|uniref:SusC/RagA family TonB-linked outer membrane protein n=1 Tax=Dysgonomonas sp. BGC7 TaxID=1658008 RepID=UPI000680FD3B|nr:TonB-dependent receptor [Dysgonomonas sp. BGC7]